MGAQTLDAGDLRWLSPLPLWTGILAGPIAWAFDLMASYAVVKWVCQTRNHGVLDLSAIVSFAIVVAAAVISWIALRHSSSEGPSDGGRPRQRARFMAILGLATSALFALQIIAGAIPPRVLDACQ